MESKFSPSLANLFMAWREKHYVFSVHNPFGDTIVWHRCYIDDLLLVLVHDVAPVHTFLEYLNTNKHNLSFTCQWDDTNVNFFYLTLIGDVANSRVNTLLSGKSSSGKPYLGLTFAIPSTPFQPFPLVSTLELVGPVARKIISYMKRMSSTIDYKIGDIKIDIK